MTRKTLVVDDALTSVRAAQAMIENTNDGNGSGDVLGAYTAAEAVRLFEEHHPETVLLDIDLPDMGGHELAKDLQEMDPEAHIVVLTALGDEDRRVRETREQGLDVLEKPLRGEDLEAVFGANGGAE